VPLDVAAELAARIGRQGSIRFDEFVDVALYHPAGGFFAGGSGAGRRGGDFITSPEVGPLFGAVVAKYLDARWEDLGRPDPFVVVEAAAGRGALALAVLAAAPACATALRYVLVERSPVLREAQGAHLSLADPSQVLGPDPDPEEDRPSPVAGGGPLVCRLGDLPAPSVVGVVVANELLDDVPPRLLERSATGWHEVRVTAAPDTPDTPDTPARWVELLVPADAAASAAADLLAPDAAVGDRIPLHDGAADWLRRALDVVAAGSVLVVDYASATTAELASRPWTDWLRTYREHERGGHPLVDPGGQDITVEVAIDQLARVAPPDGDDAQADWLRRWGIDGLVEAGRREWEARRGVADLAALRARSRAVEADALLDPTGLGAFRVLEWRR
jgi:SAM-dependent MidA family methyltransferase